MLVFFSIEHDEQSKVWHVLSHVKHDEVSVSPIGKFSYQENDQDEIYQKALDFGQQWTTEFAIEHDCFVRDPILVS